MVSSTVVEFIYAALRTETPLSIEKLVGSVARTGEIAEANVSVTVVVSIQLATAELRAGKSLVHKISFALPTELEL